MGDGPLRPSLEALASKSTEGLVTFAGTRNDVARLLHAIDIFVLPSLNEALPIVVLEAISAGLPVIATRVGGVPEVVEDGRTGVLVAPGSEDAIYWALRNLISDRKHRAQIARAGQAHVRANFSIEHMVERIESLYESQLARKQKSRSKASDSPGVTTLKSGPDGALPSTVQRHIS